MSEPKPVYVLSGVDAFLRDAHRQNVLAQVIGDSDPQTSVTHFDSTAELATVLDELRTMPFLSPRRAVIIDDADAFISAYRQQIERYLSAPSSSSSLVMMVNSWPGNTRLAKLTAQIGEVLDCSAPKQQDLPRWLDKVATKRGKKMDSQAAVLLAQWRGADLAALQSEVEKLSLYVGERPTITLEDVSELVTATAGAGAFDMTDAVMAQNTQAALRALGKQLNKRGDEFQILGMLAWNLRRMLQIAQDMANGVSAERACSKAKIFQSQQRQVQQTISRRGLAKLQNDFRRLLAADLSLKSGGDATTALSELLVHLCT